MSLIKQKIYMNKFQKANSTEDKSRYLKHFIRHGGQFQQSYLEGSNYHPNYQKELANSEFLFVAFETENPGLFNKESDKFYRTSPSYEYINKLCSSLSASLKEKDIISENKLLKERLKELSDNKLLEVLKQLSEKRDNNVRIFHDRITVKCRIPGEKEPTVELKTGKVYSSLFNGFIIIDTRN